MSCVSYPALIMNLTVFRRTTQIGFILLIFLVPVLDILRYDTASHELIVFGRVWGLGLDPGFYNDRSAAGAFRITSLFLLKAVFPWLLVLAIFPLLGVFTGRLFCAWLCPEGALFELADFLTLKLTGKRSLYVRAQNDPHVAPRHRVFFSAVALICAAVIPLSAGIALSGYFIAPKTIFNQLVRGEPSFGLRAGIIGVSMYIMTTSIFVRHALCKFVCAAGLMQMLFVWASPLSLRVKMDLSRAKDCSNCGGCERACFMKVMPRKNKRDISCVNCGACIRACRNELGNKRGLFSYTFGPAADNGTAADTSKKIEFDTMTTSGK